MYTRVLALAAAMLIVVLAGAISVFGTTAADGGSTRVDAKVLDQIADRGSTTFWVVLEQKADLRPAASVQNSTSRGEFVYDELRKTADRSQAGLRALLARRGADYKPFWILNSIRVTGDQALLDELAARSEVQKIIADPVFRIPDPIVEKAEPRIDAVEWGIDRIRAPLVWSTYGDRGAGIVVANIDTGVRYTHQAVVRQYRGNNGATFDHNYNWYDPSLVCGSPSLAPCDNNAHGTHTMGTMVGEDASLVNQIGVAPAAKWIAAKGCETNSCSTSALLASGQWILAPTNLIGQNPRPDLRPHIVNNSWGNSNGGDTFYQATVNAWIASGIFPTFSNGNTGPGCGTVGSPGSYPASYGVGAFDINNVIYAGSRAAVLRRWAWAAESSRTSRRRA